MNPPENHLITWALCALRQNFFTNRPHSSELALRKSPFCRPLPRGLSPEMVLRERPGELSSAPARTEWSFARPRSQGGVGRHGIRARNRSRLYSLRGSCFSLAEWGNRSSERTGDGFGVRAVPGHGTGDGFGVRAVPGHGTGDGFGVRAVPGHGNICLHVRSERQTRPLFI